MKNYQVVFYFETAPYFHSIFIDNVILKERIVGEENGFKCIEFLRRGKQVASFYPSEELKFEIREV